MLQPLKSPDLNFDRSSIAQGGVWCKMGKFGQNARNLRKMWCEFGQNAPNVGKIRARCSKFGQHVVQNCRIRAKCSKFGKIPVKCSNVGQNARFRLKFNIRAKFVEIRTQVRRIPCKMLKADGQTSRANFLIKFLDHSFRYMAFLWFRPPSDLRQYYWRVLASIYIYMYK